MTILSEINDLKKRVKTLEDINYRLTNLIETFLDKTQKKQ